MLHISSILIFELIVHIEQLFTKRTKVILEKKPKQPTNQANKPKYALAIEELILVLKLFGCVVSNGSNS